MPRFPGIFGGSATSSARSSTHSLTQISEESQLQDALEGCTYILKDDMVTAESRLSSHDSSFHKFGLATASFMRAVLSFEADSMAEASTRVSAAASAAGTDQARSQRNNQSFRSEIYEPGTEYAICQAEANILGAVLGILNESVTEALRGFYNVRKAYMVLDGVLERERAYARKHGIIAGSSRPSMDAPTRAGTSEAPPRAAVAGPAPPAPARQDNSDDSDDDEFVEAPQWHIGPVPNNGYLGHVETSGGSGAPDSAGMARLSLDSTRSTKSTRSTAPQPPPPQQSSSSSADSDLGDEILPRHLITNPMDAYIHSSTYLFFGLLQLMLSLIPPTMSKLLSVIGFRGSRTLGLSLLWRATTFDNLNGAMASVIVLSYYTGLVAYLDILPATGPGAFPEKRCADLIHKLRQRYPESTLMMLQEVRMLTTERRLAEGVALLGKQDEAKLKQLEALKCFEGGLNWMYSHEYEKCAASFEQCIKLNNWSHGLYIYIIASCHIELYRTHSSSSPPDTQLATKHAQLATSFLEKIPQNTNKKRFLSKQLPFDVFVNRKLAKWTARSKAWGVSLVEAVGVSPIEEMCFWWGGHARMGIHELSMSLQRLGWSDGNYSHVPKSAPSTANMTPSKHWAQESVDEHAMLALLRSHVLRQLGQLDAAQKMLRVQIIEKVTNEDVKKVASADTWPLPVARYEMAVCYWLRTREGRRTAGTVGTGLAGAGEQDTAAITGDVGMDEQGRRLSNPEALRLCYEWLEKVAGVVDSWELESRFGNRLSTGKETLRELGVGA